LISFLLVGCASHQSEPIASYDPLPSRAATPNSNNSAQRVYNATVTAPDGGSVSVTKHGRDTSGSDRDLGRVIQNMILSDRELVPYPGKVVTTIEPASNGTVVLSGSVPSKAVRENLVRRVKEVPGVKEVKDELAVEIPHSSREVDISADAK